MREGERSLRMALDSIWRMRSRVTCGAGGRAVQGREVR